MGSIPFVAMDTIPGEDVMANTNLGTSKNHNSNEASAATSLLDS